MFLLPDPVRLVTLLVIHCTFTPPSMDIGVTEIDRWHRQEGWMKVGYHFVIRRDGTIEKGRSINEVGAHAKNHNMHSIGIALVGGKTENSGKPRNNFTKAQFDALTDLLSKLTSMYPNAVINGHGELEGHEGRDCPCFDVRKFARELPWEPQGCRSCAPPSK